MTLISVAISVAYFYSMATLFWDIGEDFFWELVTLIDIMLLGHCWKCAASARPLAHWMRWLSCCRIQPKL